VRATAPTIDAVARVDVGIPTHGRPRYVVEAIESVLAQELDDWRLTISEDGEGSGVVAAAVAPYLGDPRISYITTGGHVGAAANMSGLIQRGEAPFVALLHDDDRWEPTFLARRIAFLEEHPDCGLVCSSGKVIDETGAVLRPIPVKMPVAMMAPEAFARAMLRRNLVPTPTVLVRRAAYKSVGPAFDGRFARIYDYEMWLRIGTRYAVATIPDQDASWRSHREQSTVRGRRRGEELLAFLDHAEALIERELPQVRLDGAARRYVRGRRLLSAGLDAVEREQPREALGLFGQAVRMHPPLLANTRLVAALAGLAAGARGRRLLGAARLHARRKNIRVPV
jgi:glycosyltransferase involved in cell wall biosynthesis